MTIIGIDPSSAKGQALSYWMDGKLINNFKITTIKEWVEICRDYNIDLVQIEDQYMANNFGAAKDLVFQVGKMAGICEAFGITYEPIPPITWQSKLEITQITKIIKSHLKDGEKISEYRKDKIKQSIYIDIAKMIDININNDDLACAILITYATNFITKDFKQMAIDIMHEKIQDYFNQRNVKNGL